jgi:hypothetical protein
MQRAFPLAEFAEERRRSLTKSFLPPRLALPPILDLGLFHSLPLHVVSLVGAADAKSDAVINHPAGAGSAGRSRFLPEVPRRTLQKLRKATHYGWRAALTK